MHDESDQSNVGNGGGGGTDSGIQETPLITVPLCPDHRAGEFRTEKSARVERFIQKEAADQIRRNLCRVFVLPNPNDAKQIWGYYSLSAAIISRELMSSKQRAHLGRDSAPMALIGFMGRTDGLESKKYGPWLIQDAARRAARLREHIGIWGLMLDAETDKLMEWYSARGFARPSAERVDPNRPRLMYAPLSKFLPELDK